MEKTNKNIVSLLFFRLLPVQIVLAVINAADGLISGLFAGNFAGANALSAIGLYNPINMLISAISAIILVGTQVICGKLLAKHEVGPMRSVFSLNILTAAVVSVVITAALLIMGLFHLTVPMAPDADVRAAFDRYLIGHAIGILPFLLGQQLFMFLSVELRNRRTTIASISYIVVSVIANLLFVKVLDMGAFGLALATSAASWVFLLVLGSYYLKKDTLFRFSLSSVKAGFLKEMLKTGLPGGLMPGYQFIRGIIVNALITGYVGPDGLSAFAAANSLLGIVWAIPAGIQAVSRTLFSVYAGEEDRISLIALMKTVLYKCIPGMCIIAGSVIALAVPLTSFFYRDPSLDVYRMTVDAFRILPICMPFSVFCMNFVCLNQSLDRQAIIHVNTAFDGFICVAGFTALLIKPLGINGLYWANVLNGVVTVLIFIIYAVIVGKGFPRNTEGLMAIPEGFGVPPEDRLSIQIHDEAEVVQTSEQVHGFCLSHGIGERKSYFAALCLEEMAGNIVSHGFIKDTKKHNADICVIFKAPSLILRIKDDCIPFDPSERKDIIYPDDICKNIGIRMTYSIADNIDYQQLLGLNVLTIRLDA